MVVDESWLWTVAPDQSSWSGEIGEFLSFRFFGAAKTSVEDCSFFFFFWKP